MERGLVAWFSRAFLVSVATFAVDIVSFALQISIGLQRGYLNSTPETMFCSGCGSPVQILFSFCPSCGESLKNDPDRSSREENSSISRKRVQSSSSEARPGFFNGKLPTYEQFVSKKSGERRGHFKPKTRKLSSAMAVKEATINIGLMEYVAEEEGDVLNPVRGSSLPLKVKTNAGYDEILEAALKKREAFDRKFCHTMHRGYVLAYPDSRIAKKMPGTSEEFILSDYKDWLGRPYSRLSLYLSPIEKDIRENYDSASAPVIDWSELEPDFATDLSVPEVIVCEAQMGNSAVQNEDLLRTADLSFMTTDFL